jgi:hypothetical protein
MRCTVIEKKQALYCKSEAAGAILKCRISRFYTVMDKLQGLHCNAEVAGAKF